MSTTRICGDESVSLLHSKGPKIGFRRALSAVHSPLVDTQFPGRRLLPKTLFPDSVWNLFDTEIHFIFT